MKMTMKHCASLLVLAIAATATLASCSSEEMTDNPVETLPEGMYPLTFTATQGEVVASPQTRVSDYDDAGTHKSKWNTGDQITVKVKENSTETVSTTTCTFNENGNITYNPQLYWQTTGNHTINAWYSNITGQNTTSSTVSLADQSSGLAYVMKADALTDKNYQSGNLSLDFKHQLAKVRVKLVTGTTTEDLSNATVKIKNQYTSCSISNGAVTATGTSNGTITMHTPTTTDGYYEANIVPGTTLSADCFEITAGGKTASATTTAITTTAAATMYTFTITVDKPGVAIIDDLGNPVSADNINTNVTVTGSGDQTLNITANVNVTLDNVTIAEGTGAPIKIAENCSPTIIIKGDTNLSFSKGGWMNSTGGIQLEKNASVTVKGSDTSGDKLTITNKDGWGAGIGSAYNTNNNPCGDITIINLVAEITTKEGGAAIGSGAWGSCGKITITNSTLNLSTMNGAAAIGTGALRDNVGNGDCACGDIEITDSDITASAGNYYAAFPSVIGCGGKYSVQNGIPKCGDITITLKSGQTQEQFENLLITGSNNKVGTGSNGGQIGTITYKNN